MIRRRDTLQMLEQSAAKGENHPLTRVGRQQQQDHPLKLGAQRNTDKGEEHEKEKCGRRLLY
jgi:hypothetical protein